MQHKHILKSLPLLASILGREYGVQVRIGGKSAYTDGNIIQLPGLPVYCNETLIGMVRGLIDHESSHIRHTDFEALKAAGFAARKARLEYLRGLACGKQDGRDLSRLP